MVEQEQERAHTISSMHKHLLSRLKPLNLCFKLMSCLGFSSSLPENQ